MDANGIAIGMMRDKADVMHAPNEAWRRYAIASAARAALQGMLSNPELTNNWNHVTDAACPPRYAHIAVAYATALVDELEKEGAADR